MGVSGATTSENLHRSPRRCCRGCLVSGRPCDCQREPSYHSVGSTAGAGSCLRVLLLALATGMAEHGIGNGGIAHTGLGMDTLLHFDLAHGSCQGRRAAGERTCQGFQLFTPILVITPIVAAAQVKLLHKPPRCAILASHAGFVPEKGFSAPLTEQSGGSKLS